MKVVPIFLKYDYGKKEWGPSTEQLIIVPALKKVAQEVIPFWLEENGFPDDIKGLQDKILSFVDKNKPDAVFFMLMNDEVSLETIEKLSKNYITINWFCDDQWRFESFSNHVGPKLTHPITVDKYSVDKFKDIGCKNVIKSQWPSFEYIEGLELKNVEYKYDISFIGQKNLTREWYIKELKKSGFNVECFGNGWDNGKVSFEDMKDIFLKSKINLNLSNSVLFDIRFYFSVFKDFKFTSPIKSFKKIKSAFGMLIKGQKRFEQIKARIFEVPAHGGFLLTCYNLETEDYFDIGKEIAVFASIDDLKLQLKYYLTHDDLRERIKISGYKKAAGHTWENRLKAVFDEIKNKK